MSDGPTFRHAGDGREPGAEHPVDREDPEPVEVGAHVAELDTGEQAKLGRHLHASDVARQLDRHRADPTSRERHR